MATESVHVSDVIPASAERIYRAWLDGVEHAAMTGGAATAEPHVGGRFSAWDGYIRGTNVALEPGRRIVQAWRSADFPEGSPDSRLEILLEADPAGTRVTLIHSEIPEGQGADYEQGWRDHYFMPMRLYFTRSSVPTPVSVPETPPPPIAPLQPAALPPIPSLVSTMPRPAAIAMPPAEEWEEIETTVMKSPPVELILPSEPKPVKPAAAKKPAVKSAPAKKPAAKKPAVKKPVKKAAAKKTAAKKPAAKKPAKKAAARRSAAKKSAKPVKKAAPKKAPAKKKPAPKKKGKR